MSDKVIFQQTLRKEGSLKGTGLHTGEPCAVRFSPLPEDSGVQFYKEGSRAEGYSRGATEKSLRCTSVGEGASEIKTVEHLMAALCGMGIDNLRVDVTGPEIPALDGSAKEFVETFKKLGVKKQNKQRNVFKLREPIFCHGKEKAISVYPAEELRVAYVMDYDHPQLKHQQVDFVVNAKVFEKEIAPARTFCTEAESHFLREQGFGKGADYKNTLVLSEKGVIKNSLRFEDECVRHKVLDLLGDLNLLGFPLAARIIGLKSGHSLNRKMVEQIKRQRES